MCPVDPAEHCDLIYDLVLVQGHLVYYYLVDLLAFHAVTSTSQGLLWQKCSEVQKSLSFLLLLLISFGLQIPLIFTSEVHPAPTQSPTTIYSSTPGTAQHRPQTCRVEVVYCDVIWLSLILAVMELYVVPGGVITNDQHSDVHLDQSYSNGEYAGMLMRSSRRVRFAFLPATWCCRRPARLRVLSMHVQSSHNAHHPLPLLQLHETRPDPTNTNTYLTLSLFLGCCSSHHHTNRVWLS